VRAAWQGKERDLLFHMTQLISRYNAKSHYAKSNEFSVEVIITENTMAKELINVNKYCHFVT